jgi:hypothetical protein
MAMAVRLYDSFEAAGAAVRNLEALEFRPMTSA